MKTTATTTSAQFLDQAGTFRRAYVGSPIHLRSGASTATYEQLGR